MPVTVLGRPHTAALVAVLHDGRQQSRDPQDDEGAEDPESIAAAPGRPLRLLRLAAVLVLLSAPARTGLVAPGLHGAPPRRVDSRSGPAAVSVTPISAASFDIVRSRTLFCPSTQAQGPL